MPEKKAFFSIGSVDAAEGIAGVGTQNGRGLFNGIVDLQQGGGAGLNGHRHIPEGEDDHQDACRCR